ncbi:hypothetical protein AAHE18_02G094700 [Arachis hypogaea]
MATMIAKGCSEGKASRVLYMSGEESLEQIGNRAERLRIKSDIYLYSSTDIEFLGHIEESSASFPSCYGC